jgi:NAD(P)-dependent dehydrogenase (short-subunit alcohol dehydrogenase family)
MAELRNAGLQVRCDNNPAQFQTLALDVTNTQSILEAVRPVTALTEGRLHCLVNNVRKAHNVSDIQAGAYGSGLTLDNDLVKVRQIFEVNVFGVIAVS